MHLTEEQLVLIYYNEPEAGAASRAHLADCAECQRSAESLAAVLDSCSQWQIPEPDPQLARSIWTNIVPQLDEFRPRRRWRWFSSAVAIAAVLLLAFLAGRYSQRPQPSVLAGLSTQAQRRILAITLADHLDRAEMLMTEISNTDEPVDRTRAQDLVEEGRLLRQTLARQGESATLSMLDDLERFLLEAANAPKAQTPELRSRIASDSLIFKVRIIESNLRNQGRKI